MSASSPADSNLLDHLAAQLWSAQERRTPIAPLTPLITAPTIVDAYRVQEINSARRLAAGAVHSGWKIGLTSPAVQQQLGVGQPDFGRLFVDMAAGHGEPVAAGRLLQPRVEAEVAFVLAQDLPDRPLTAVDVIRATDFVVPAIEIVDSRIAEWRIGIFDTIADNASSGLYVVGGRPTRLADVDLATVPMRMTLDGKVVSSGDGSQCLAHPINAIIWLADTLRATGNRVRAGDVLLSGALGPMTTVAPGSRYIAEIEGLGSVIAAFAAEDE